jgi:hypothetical protein
MKQTRKNSRRRSPGYPASGRTWLAQEAQAEMRREFSATLVDPWELAKEIGVSTLFAWGVTNIRGVTFECKNKLAVRGLSAGSGMHAWVWVRPTLSYHNRKWTLAHELSHHLLGHTGKGPDSEIDGAIHEDAATWLADEMLMPERLLRRATSCVGANITRLAELFDVSREQMRNRLCRLNWASGKHGDRLPGSLSVHGSGYTQAMRLLPLVCH